MNEESIKSIPSNRLQFFSIMMFAIILNRIIFHAQFMPKFMPILFILIAPPAIGFISYIKLTGNLDFLHRFCLILDYFLQF